MPEKKYQPSPEATVSKSDSSKKESGGNVKKSSLLDKIKKWGLRAGFIGVVGSVGGLTYELKNQPASEADLKEQVKKADTEKADEVRERISKFGHTSEKAPKLPEENTGSNQSEIDDSFDVSQKEVEVQDEDERLEKENKKQEAVKNFAEKITQKFGNTIVTECEGSSCTVYRKGDGLSDDLFSLKLMQFSVDDLDFLVIKELVGKKNARDIFVGNAANQEAYLLDTVAGAKKFKDEYIKAVKGVGGDENNE